MFRTNREITSAKQFIPRKSQAEVLVQVVISRRSVVQQSGSNLGDGVGQ